MGGTKNLIATLGYEQIRALQILRDKPDIEASALCAEADCSFGELFGLGVAGLIDPGMERLERYQANPTLTAAGHEAVAQAAAAGLGRP